MSPAKWEGATQSESIEGERTERAKERSCERREQRTKSEATDEETAREDRKLPSTRKTCTNVQVFYIFTKERKYIYYDIERSIHKLDGRESNNIHFLIEKNSKT